MKKRNKKFQKKGGNSLKEYSKNAPFSFNAKNYKLLLIGLAINILGFILMIGGAAEDPMNLAQKNYLVQPVLQSHLC